MKICPECHKLSRDDDFCSHCGAAVYDDCDYTAQISSCSTLPPSEHLHGQHSYSAEISCDNIPGHTHEEVSFLEYERRRKSSRPEERRQLKFGAVFFFIFIMTVIYLSSLSGEEFAALSRFLSDIFQ